MLPRVRHVALSYYLELLMWYAHVSAARRRPEYQDDFASIAGEAHAALAHLLSRAAAAAAAQDPDQDSAIDVRAHPNPQPETPPQEGPGRACKFVASGGGSRSRTRRISDCDRHVPESDAICPLGLQSLLQTHTREPISWKMSFIHYFRPVCKYCRWTSSKFIRGHQRNPSRANEIPMRVVASRRGRIVRAVRVVCVSGIRVRVQKARCAGRNS